jgi:hypothetical protein
MKRVHTHADFDEISWHDNEIWGFELQIGDPDRDDWTSDLVLDIDHIVEWVRSADGMRFRVAPADLVFHGATDLRIGIDCGPIGQQVSLMLPSISHIQREPIQDQRVFLDRPYYRWCIPLNGYPDGEISFGAYGFTQTLRREPVLCDVQRLDRASRGALR